MAAKTTQVKLTKTYRCVAPGVGEFKGKSGDTLTVPESVAKHIVGIKAGEYVTPPAPVDAPAAPAAEPATE